MITKIKNHPFGELRTKIKNNEAGFTLVELLASVIVLVAVGSIVTGIITSSLRGANKTNAIENIRQNGNYALNQMSKDIEYAQSFDGENTGFSNDESAYVASCPYSLNPTPAPVTTAYNFIAVESVNSTITKYKCTSAPPALSANGVSLIDAGLVSLQNCSLTCIQSKSTDIPILKINFSIGSKNQNALMENSSPPIKFETSVVLRNYKK